MTYNPEPIDTSGVELTVDIKILTEQLAKNTHDIWAKNRIAEGWVYGENRDDQKKEHPCLVPYEDLPDNEKQYDRNTAIEALKAITALGYKVEKKEVFHGYTF